LDASCGINSADLTLFTQSYQTSNWWADFNCSGFVTLSDFSLFGTHNGHNCGSQRTIPIPPEFVARLLAKSGEGDALLEDSPAMPTKFALEPNFPNPFNPATEIRYAVPAPGGHVSIEVFDASGTRIKVLVDQDKQAGTYAAIWKGTNENGSQVPSGVYFCRMKAPQFTANTKMILVR
jgi:hypothetical protein